MAAICKRINQATSATFEVLRALLLRVGVVWDIALRRWMNIWGVSMDVTVLTFGTKQLKKS